ncbi:MAG: hypothetical protein HY694_12130 [Deltaproteobacteria bacterium]|nr:hypothetical protein [Deltaproteobacteria bacterium]
MKKLTYGIAIVALIATAFIFTQGFTPPPAGFTKKFMWTGARTITGSTSVAVHCTNFDDAIDSTVHTEFVDFDGDSEGTDLQLVAAGETRTIVGGDDTAFYAEDSTVALGSDLNQGSVRVSVKGSKKVICSAHVLDNTSIPPLFIHDLPTFSATGAQF